MRWLCVATVFGAVVIVSPEPCVAIDPVLSCPCDGPTVFDPCYMPE